MDYWSDNTRGKKRNGERYHHNGNLECKNVTTEWNDGSTGRRDGSFELEHPGSIGDALDGHWEGATKAGYKIWFCGGDKKVVHRVGFLVNKNTKNSILECTLANNRVIAIRVAGKPFSMTIVQVYAPKSESSGEIIDDFYEDLEKLLKSIPRKDVLVVQEDFDARIGRDAGAGWKGTVGKFGIGETNERGLKHLEFAKRHQLTTVTTLFGHKLSRRTTWHSPDGRTHNQIDCIFVRRRHSTGVNRARTRTFNKPDIGNDHDLVMMTLQLKLKETRRISRQEHVVIRRS